MTDFRRRRRELMVSALVALGFAADAPAMAQTVPPASETSAERLGEIIVTAQRRSERLQDVPISVTALDAKGLADARVTNISNISAVTPSITIAVANNTSSAVNIQIRGLGTAGVAFPFEGSVGLFVDGVYRTRAGAALQEFLDIDSLQVLKGPQGTLFGKNTSAGAILLTSTAPSFEKFSGNGEAGIGNYNSLQFKGAINAPLSDNVAVRVAGLYAKQDGFYNNLNTGRRTDGKKTYAGKIQVLAEPTPDLSIRLVADISKTDGNCCYATSYYGVDPVSLYPVLAGLIPTFGGKNPPPPSAGLTHTVALNRPGNQNTNDRGVALIMDYKIGGGTLKSITAFRRYTQNQVNYDSDFNGLDILDGNQKFDSKSFSQELNYTGTAKFLHTKYVLGAFLSRDDLNIPVDLIWGDAAQAYINILFGTPPGFAEASPGIFASNLFKNVAKSYAAFVHTESALSSSVNLITGLRYSIEEKTGSFENRFYRSAPAGSVPALTLAGSYPSPDYNASTNDKALSGTFGIQYLPSRDINIYATYNRGFKAGGVGLDANSAGGVANNPAVTPGAVPLDPRYGKEIVNGFELGGKFIYLNRRARTNFAFFYNYSTGIQVVQLVGIQADILNAKSATSYGLDMENTFQLSRYFTLDLGGSWLPHAEYGVDPKLDPAISGTRVIFAPKLAGNAAVTANLPLSDSVNLTGRLAYQYTSRERISSQIIPTSATNPGDSRGAVGLVNANLGLASPDDRWRIVAWVQNLTDKTYPTIAFATPFVTGLYTAYLGAPRTFGLTVSGKF